MVLLCSQQNKYIQYSCQIMKQLPYTKPLPYSLLASMYASWEQYKIPAIYYHYFLSVLKNMEKKQQVLLMTKQIKTLKSDTHAYHRIVNAIEAREQSLAVINRYIHILMQYQSTDEMEWPSKNADLNFDGEDHEGNRYKILYEDQRSPLLLPTHKKKTVLMELLNHIRMYQRVSLQTIYLISQWESQLIEMGYTDSIIQFQYHQQDYLQRMNQDTLELLSTYQGLFENNPFFIMKKLHQKSEYALIYAELKPEPDLLQKMYECLNIIATHEANILKFRMLAKAGQSGNRRKAISKSTDIHKIYMNYNKGHNYIMITDSQTMKKSKVVYDPLTLSMMKKNPQSFNKLKSMKNDIVINPLGASPYSIDKTVRKNPAKVSLNFLASDSEDRAFLRTPEMNTLSPRQPKSSKNSKQIASPYIRRSLSQHPRIMKNNENLDFDNNTKQRVQVKALHGQNTIIVHKSGNNNREDYLDRNKGLSTQKKLEAIHSVDQQLKHQVKNKLKNEKLKSSKQEQRQQTQQESEVNKETSQTVTQISEDNQISLTFEESVKQTQVVKYLRNKVFNNTQAEQIGFEQIQALAKKLLLEKDYITFVRVDCRGMRIAWLAVKFVEKDNTMRRSVMIVYVRKFVRLSGFERKLLDTFVSHGYGLIRNQQQILYEIQLLDIVTKPLIRVKYKVNPCGQKSQIKEILKRSKVIGQSRLLKYHSYSKSTKYHKFCQHEKTCCVISYNFLDVCKISIEQSCYLLAKADKIIKLGEEIYRITCAVNQSDLIIARTLTDVLSLQQEAQIERDSSFDSKCETQFQYIAIKQGKWMKKYVNEKEVTVISEFVTINGNIPEVRSISMNRDQLGINVLLMNPPFFIAIMTREEGESKSLAVVEFQ